MFAACWFTWILKAFTWTTRRATRFPVKGEMDMTTQPRRCMAQMGSARSERLDMVVFAV